MKFVYTNHAKEKIKEREISRKLIEDTFKNPDKILDGRFGRKILHKLIKEKLLRIVYEEENSRYIIITVYFTKPERYR